MMDEGCVLASCLHGGAIPLAEALDAEAYPAWLETQCDLPAGTVARALQALCREYGSCGVMAVDDGQVVGKVRFGPTEVCDDIPFCAQQMPDRLAALAAGALPKRTELTRESLSILCLQLTSEHRGRGIATAMVRRVIAWAREGGWEEIRAKATRPIPPLIEWTGMFSLHAYEKLGFGRTGQAVAFSEMVDGVRSMRAGHHGEDVREQWAPFAGLSDEEAAEVYPVVLCLR